VLLQGKMWYSEAGDGSVGIGLDECDGCQLAIVIETAAATATTKLCASRNNMSKNLITVIQLYSK